MDKLYIGAKKGKYLAFLVPLAANLGPDCNTKKVMLEGITKQGETVHRSDVIEKRENI